MSYPKVIKCREFKINLPYPKVIKPFIFEFFEIFGEEEDDPRQTVMCKSCKTEIYMIRGRNVNSSYTFGLTCHLQKHSREWNTYLDLLKETAMDTKSKFEHFQSMSRQCKSTNMEESSKNFRESERNFKINAKNCAGVFYTQRDCEVLNKKFNEKHDNAKLLKYLYPYTNQNVALVELMGEKHSSAELHKSYKKSKCLVDNEGDMAKDFEKLFCPNICFFDPELFDDCPEEHKGDLNIFGDEEYQARFEGFKKEIEKYPEFQFNKSFNIEVFKEVTMVEKDRTAVREMNRLLKIILSLLIVYKQKIDEKISRMIDIDVDDEKLQRPSLAIQLWGPKYNNVDADEEEDESVLLHESQFSTYQHIENEDCPAYKDHTKDISKEAHFEDEKAYYPCNFGSCLKRCSCIPCKHPENYLEPNTFRCSDHNINHPKLFDESMDLSVPRRKFFSVGSKKPIYKRPKEHKHLCPPMIKLAGMKKKCKRCKEIFQDHRRNHHILHPACQICSHMDFVSRTSFNLTCHVCLKSFNNKYKLADHQFTHGDSHNSFYCNICEKGFTGKFNYEQHIMTNHGESADIHKCDQCNNTFSSRTNLKRHIATKHSSTTPEEYVCTICGKIFKRADNLIKHERINHQLVRNETILPGINDEEKYFNCDICTKRFNQKCTLRRHIESTHAIKSYQCNVCGKGFNRKDTLQIHQQIHNKTVI